VSKKSQMLDEVYSIIKEIHGNKNERDEYTLSGKQVVLKIRKLSSPYAKIIVQHIINTTLRQKWTNTIILHFPSLPINLPHIMYFHMETCIALQNSLMQIFLLFLKDLIYPKQVQFSQTWKIHWIILNFKLQTID